MSFSSKADLIRKKLRKFTKHSIINEEIARLSKPVSESYHEAQKMPWLSFLLIEWLYQVEKFPHAVDATSKDVYDIRQHLQSFLQSKDIEKNSPIGTDYLSKRKDELFDALTNTLKRNNDYWKNNGVAAAPEFFKIYYEFSELMR